MKRWFYIFINPIFSKGIFMKRIVIFLGFFSLEFVSVSAMEKVQMSNFVSNCRRAIAKHIEQQKIETGLKRVLKEEGPQAMFIRSVELSIERAFEEKLPGALEQALERTEVFDPMIKQLKQINKRLDHTKKVLDHSTEKVAQMVKELRKN